MPLRFGHSSLRIEGVIGRTGILVTDLAVEETEVQRGKEACLKALSEPGLSARSPPPPPVSCTPHAQPQPWALGGGDPAQREQAPVS